MGKMNGWGKYSSEILEPFDLWQNGIEIEARVTDEDRYIHPDNPQKEIYLDVENSTNLYKAKNTFCDSSWSVPLGFILQGKVAGLRNNLEIDFLFLQYKAQ